MLSVVILYALMLCARHHSSRREVNPRCKHPSLFCFTFSVKDIYISAIIPYKVEHYRPRKYKTRKIRFSRHKLWPVKFYNFGPSRNFGKPVSFLVRANRSYFRRKSSPCRSTTASAPRSSCPRTGYSFSRKEVEQIVITFLKKLPKSRWN